MKKTYVALIALIIGLFLVACGGQSIELTEQYPEIHTSIAENDETNEDEPNDTPTTLYTLIETTEGIQRIFPPGTLTIEHFLEDIDYLMYVLENNFALLEVAYWAWDTDAQVLADNARKDILAAYEAGILCENRFLALLIKNFFPLTPTGHFDIFTPRRYLGMVTNPYNSNYYSPGVILNNRLLETPLALRFYEYRAQNLDYFAGVMQEVMSEGVGVYNRLVGDFSNPRQFEPHTIITEVLEEGRIAYISVNSFMPPSGAAMIIEQQQLFDFYIEISDFEHFIIDLRGNLGGNIHYFRDNIFRPFLEETVTINSFHFFMDGPYIRRLGDAIFARTASNGHLIISDDYRPISEILEEHELSELRTKDMERLRYATVSTTGRIHPNRRHAGEEMGFSGEIWMLTDVQMFSAAQAAARMSMDTGFATHVGERTGGSSGGLRALALLPNTGIAIYFDVFYLTDERGRPLEAGTIPHHFNREGMDALETVLALIAEGEY